MANSKWKKSMSRTLFLSRSAANCYSANVDLEMDFKEALNIFTLPVKKGRKQVAANAECSLKQPKALRKMKSEDKEKSLTLPTSFIVKIFHLDLEMDFKEALNIFTLPVKKGRKQVAANAECSLKQPKALRKIKSKDKEKSQTLPTSFIVKKFRE
ncbi:hypothetical protein F8388_023556 [Cannabis sativa]|uniref:Uncharacterized protein n=1 Tax=Cannabis sativa TaxID=3483 RepID=A0A7J6GBN5_CANSA|nr:hypothetical protein F8388_023556 [Cannabis sativa]